MKRAILSPGKYIQGTGEINHLGEYAAGLGKKSAYAIISPSNMKNNKEAIENSFKNQNLTVTMEQFNRECCKEEIDRLVDSVNKATADIIVGIGGGKALDTAKAVAYFAKLPVMIVPTIASTDAPCSALSVLYTASGVFQEYLVLRTNPEIVVVDTDIVVAAPARLLVSGIGDALATYFEAQATADSGASPLSGGTPSKAALALAELCLQTLLSDGYKAKLAVENKTSSQAVENIIEANTYLSGLGFESGGLAAAHAVHNGLTVIEDCHSMYHGEKVAFGTIVQLVLQNAPLEDILEIVDFCKSVGLPTTLEALGVKEDVHAKMKRVAEATCVETETIHNMPFKVSPEMVYSAILVADALGKEHCCC